MLLQADTNDDVASKISSWLKDVEVRGFVKYFAYNDGDSESDYEEEPEDDDDSLEASSHQYLGESKQIALGESYIVSVSVQFMKVSVQFQEH